MKKTKTSFSIPARRQPLADLTRPALQTATGGGATVVNNPLYVPGGESGENPLNHP
jgi:hypothetical protein